MTIEVERRDHLLLMGIRRPQKMNALSRDMYHSLGRAFHLLEHDPGLWAGVIWAEGPHFTSGVDLNDWAEAFASGTPFPVAAGEIDPFSITGPRLSKPLVIAVAQTFPGAAHQTCQIHCLCEAATPIANAIS